MTGPEPARGDGKGGNPPIWQIVVGIQVVVLVIALIMPITPSKTGSDGGFADFFFDAPTYLQEVAVNFVATNLLVGVLAIGSWIYLRRSRSREARGARSHRGHEG